MHQRLAVAALSLLLTLATLYFVLRGVDRNVISKLVASQDRGPLLMAALFIVLQINFAGERWRTILSAITRRKPPSVFSVQAIFYASIFFNCLPFGTIGGDIARVWLARRFALPVKQLLLSVLLDRLVTVTALVVLAIITLPTIARPLATHVWFASLVVLVFAGAGLFLLKPIERVLGRWRHHTLINTLVRAAEETGYLVRSEGITALMWGAGSVISAAVACYCIAQSLRIEIGFVPMIAIISVVMFLVALPISLAGWGIREISIVTLLGQLGVDHEAALLLSVEFGLLATLVSLPGVLVWLTLRKGGPTNFDPTKMQPMSSTSVAANLPSH